MAERPAKAVYDVLAADGNLSGESIYIGHPDDDIDRGVWCIANGGPAPIAESTGEDLRQPTVQIFVRAKPHQQESGQTLADNCWKAINRTEPAGYSLAQPLGEPINIQPDGIDRLRWSINTQLVLQE